jgi:predicted house-cleaning NTP pyrophosphatase (Maf/HAM1 superfamily)
MPFKSKAQRRKFAQLLVEGKISDKAFEEWNRETGRKHLPEHVVRRTRKKAQTKNPRAQAQDNALLTCEQGFIINERVWGFRSNASPRGAVMRARNAE